MATAVKELYERFFDRIEEDEDFFDISATDEAEKELFIYERAYELLREACAYLRRHCDLDVDLTIIQDEETGDDTIEADLNEDEKDLLAAAMLWRYYERKIVHLTPKINALSASELKYAHSPNQERTTYLALAKQVKTDLDVEITHYGARDRLTGVRKTIEYALPEEDDEDE